MRVMWSRGMSLRKTNMRRWYHWKTCNARGKCRPMCSSRYAKISLPTQFIWKYYSYGGGRARLRARTRLEVFLLLRAGMHLLRANWRRDDVILRSGARRNRISLSRCLLLPHLLTCDS